MSCWIHGKVCDSAQRRSFLKCTVVNIFCKHHQLWTRRHVCWFIQLDCKKYKWSSFDLLHYLTFDITRQILDSPLNRVIGERNCGKLIFCISSQHYVSYFQNARLHWSFPNTPIVCGFFCFAISNATKWDACSSLLFFLTKLTRRIQSHLFQCFIMPFEKASVLIFGLRVHIF